MKYFLLSKTIWFNIIIFVLALIALPQFISLLPSAAMPYIAFIGALGNLVLRSFFTSQPLTADVLKD